MNAPITPEEREKKTEQDKRAVRRAWASQLTDEQFDHAVAAVDHFTGK